MRADTIRHGSTKEDALDSTDTHKSKKHGKFRENFIQSQSSSQLRIPFTERASLVDNEPVPDESLSNPEPSVTPQTSSSFSPQRKELEGHTHTQHTRAVLVVPSSLERACCLDRGGRGGRGGSSPLEGGTTCFRAWRGSKLQGKVYWNPPPRQPGPSQSTSERWNSPENSLPSSCSGLKYQGLGALT